MLKQKTKKNYEGIWLTSHEVSTYSDSDDILTGRVRGGQIHWSQCSYSIVVLI